VTILDPEAHLFPCSPVIIPIDTEYSLLTDEAKTILTPTLRCDC